MSYDMPCCPICDNAIEDWQAHAILSDQGAKALVHSMCLEDDDDDPEDDQ